MTVLHENKKLTYGTGVMAHFYTRSGTYVNGGGSIGVLVNGSDMQWLVGGSLLFAVGKSRIAFSGGLAMGQHKVLSAENNQYLWDGKTRVFDSRYDLPAGYSGNSSPSTTDVWGKSWFAAITVNFASLTVK